MGNDLMVVNAARTSFGTESHILSMKDKDLIRFLATGYRTSEWDEFLSQVAQLAISGDKKSLTALLKAYKRRAQHWAPFGHPQVQIRMTIPIFLARQFVKHQVGGVWSEESRRYISHEPDVWLPDEWHTRPENIKQGSGELIDDQVIINELVVNSVQQSIDTYTDLIEEGLAPEEARITLPLNMMTTVTWTGSLLFWSRVYNQRIDGHAQLAAQSVAKHIGKIMSNLFPCSWEALTQ